jgi:PAS domain S-box-containing protein
MSWSEESLGRYALALHESEERFRYLFDRNPLPMFVVDRKTLAFLEVNDTFLSVYGYSRAEIMGMNLRDIRPPEDVPALELAIAHVMPGYQASGVWRHRKSDGSVIDVEIFHHLVATPGERQKIMVLAVNVTARVRAGAALHDTQRRYQSLFEHSLDAILLSDDALKLVDANPAAVALLGYAREELLQLELGDILAGRNRVKRKDGAVRETELRIVGNVRPGLHMSVLRDITERRQTEEARDLFAARLREMGHRLVSLQESERRALAAELHDSLGQSLSTLGIKLSLVEGMLAKDRGDAASLIRESRAMLEEAGRSVRGMISELRPAALHDYGLAAALRALADQSRRRFGLEVALDVYEVHPRLPPDVEAALFRVAQEALSNVAKHAGVSTVRIVLRPRHDGAALCVADDGRGFDPASLRQPGKLSRWGLLMMRERAESVGARLRIRSFRGNGTQVVVSWNSRDERPDPAGR